MKQSIAIITTVLPASTMAALNLTRLKASNISQSLSGQVTTMMGTISDKPKIREWHQVNGRSAYIIIVKVAEGYEAIVFSCLGGVKRIEARIFSPTLIEVVEGKIKVGDQFAKVVPNPETANDMMFAAA